MDDLKYNIDLNDTILIHPKFFKGNMDSIIIDNLTSRFDGKCSKHGYIIPDSLKLLKRGMGEITNNNFHGYIKFKVKYSVDIVNPVRGDKFKCNISNITKPGFYSEKDQLEISIPFHYAKNPNRYKNLKVGDEITVEVIGSKFNYTSNKINIIARLIDSSSKNIINDSDDISVETKSDISNENSELTDTDSETNSETDSDIDEEDLDIEDENDGKSTVNIEEISIADSLSEPDSDDSDNSDSDESDVNSVIDDIDGDIGGDDGDDDGGDYE